MVRGRDKSVHGLFMVGGISFRGRKYQGHSCHGRRNLVTSTILCGSIVMVVAFLRVEQMSMIGTLWSERPWFGVDIVCGWGKTPTGDVHGGEFLRLNKTIEVVINSGWIWVLKKRKKASYHGGWSFERGTKYILMSYGVSGRPGVELGYSAPKRKNWAGQLAWL